MQNQAISARAALDIATNVFARWAEFEQRRAEEAQAALADYRPTRKPHPDFPIVAVRVRFVDDELPDFRNELVAAAAKAASALAQLGVNPWIVRGWQRLAATGKTATQATIREWLELLGPTTRKALQPRRKTKGAK